MGSIRRLNEAVAVGLTRAFGTMWVCYAFMVYGLMPALALFRPQQEAFLYWSNFLILMRKQEELMADMVR